MSDNPIFVYAATYASTDDAWGDYDILLKFPFTHRSLWAPMTPR